MGTPVELYLVQLKGTRRKFLETLRPERPEMAKILESSLIRGVILDREQLQDILAFDGSRESLYYEIL